MKKNYNSLLRLCIVGIILFSTQLEAQIIANGTYKIFSTVHNEVMTCATTAPHDANMAAPNATDNFQLWTFTHQGNDVYKIVNQGNGLTLGINDGWCGNFGDAKANFANNAANVELKIVTTPETGKYAFQIAFTTCNFGSVNNPIKAFDIQDGAVGAQIQTFETNLSNPNQQFQILTPAALSTISVDKVNDLLVFYDNESGLNITSQAASLQNATLKIFDLTGKMVKTRLLEASNNSSTTISVNDLSKGLYLIQITSSNNLQTVKKIAIY